jgi:pimeloyl-ACP methyl ester carboxylesterase
MGSGPTASPPARPPCPAPKRILKEVERYDAEARVERWRSPHYEMTFRVRGEGPALLVLPGIASTYRSYAIVLNELAERFQTYLIEYPGDRPGDGARLGRIGHADLAGDVVGLLDHLGLDQAFLFGLSFGTTVGLRAMALGPGRFPRAALQGAFAYRPFTLAERLALGAGRWFPGRVGILPFHRKLLEWNHKMHFPTLLMDRWEYYVQQNAQTPIRPLAHRCDMVGRLDLRPFLSGIQSDILLIRGNEDRLISQKHQEELARCLPHAQSVVMPLAGHQPHYTHAELLARLVGDFLLREPCREAECPGEAVCAARKEASSTGCAEHREGEGPCGSG